MNKLLFLTFITALCSINAYSDNSQNYKRIEKDIDLKGTFNAIQTSVGIKVEYTVTPADKKPIAKLSVDSCVADYVMVEIKNNTLTVYFNNRDKNNIVCANNPILYLSAPAVEKFTASSGSGISIKNELSVDNRKIFFNISSGALIRADKVKCSTLSLDTSSGSKVDIASVETRNLAVSASSSSITTINKLTADNVTVSASSAAQVNLSGTAGNAGISASSAAKVIAKDLHCKIADLSASSTAYANITSQNATTSTSSLGKIDVNK